MTIAKKLTIPDELLKKTTEIVEKEGFLNFQEFVLTAIREYVKEKENQENIKFLRKLQNKSKGNYLTKKDRQKIGETFIKEKDQLEIFREFNLN